MLDPQDIAAKIVVNTARVIRGDIIIWALRLRNLAYSRALRHPTQIADNTITTVISGPFAPLQCCRIYRYKCSGRFGDHLGVGGPLSTVRLVGGAVTPRGQLSGCRRAGHGRTI